MLLEAGCTNLYTVDLGTTPLRRYFEGQLNRTSRSKHKHWTELSTLQFEVCSASTHRFARLRSQCNFIRVGQDSKARYDFAKSKMYPFMKFIRSSVSIVETMTIAWIYSLQQVKGAGLVHALQPLTSLNECPWRWQGQLQSQVARLWAMVAESTVCAAGSRKVREGGNSFTKPRMYHR